MSTHRIFAEIQLEVDPEVGLKAVFFRNVILDQMWEMLVHERLIPFVGEITAARLWVEEPIEMERMDEEDTPAGWMDYHRRHSCKRF